MRCPKGFKQQPPKSGICVKKNKTPTKRCPKGSRKNKKTGNCDKYVKLNKTRKSITPTRKNKSMSKKWNIYKIDYVYPSIHDDNYRIDRNDYGIMNIANIFMENENNVVQIIFQNNNVEMVLGKKQNKYPPIEWQDKDYNNLNELNIDVKDIISNVSDIKFVGTENDDDWNYTTKQNIDEIKQGVNGKYVQIAITTPLNDDISDNVKEKILEKTIEILQNC